MASGSLESFMEGYRIVSRFPGSGKRGPSLPELVIAGSWPDLDKWRHYLKVYDRHFSRFRGKPVRILEIGVFLGGSLRLWQEYFGRDSLVLGIDVNPACKQYECDGIAVEIGDQSDANFLQRIATQYGPFDIVIDDGSHVIDHQLASFRELSPVTRSCYVIEDTHTAYWGAPSDREKLHQFVNSLQDVLHDWFVVASSSELFDDESWAARRKSTVNPLRNRLLSVEIYDSLIVVAFGQNPPPQRWRQWHRKGATESDGTLEIGGRSVNWMSSLFSFFRRSPKPPATFAVDPPNAAPSIAATDADTAPGAIVGHQAVPDDETPIDIDGVKLTPQQYRSLYDDLIKAIPEDKPELALRHYQSHGRNEIAQRRRGVPRDRLEHIRQQRQGLRD